MTTGKKPAVEVTIFHIFAAEVLATTMVIAIQTLSVASIPHEMIQQNTVLIGLVHGFAFFAVGSTLGELSYAFGNPLLSLSFYLVQRKDKTSIIGLGEALINVAATFLGAMFGTLLTLALKGTNSSLGTPQLGDDYSQFQAFAFEIMGTFMLTTVILFAWGKNNWTLEPGLAGGFTVGMLNMVGIDISGAAFNPFRFLAPAIVSVTWRYYDWLYFAGPVIGWLAAHVVYRVVFQDVHQRGLKRRGRVIEDLRTGIEDL